MLRVENITKEFKSGNHKVLAVNDITFTVPEGSFSAIVGKSGSGKSTLLSLLGALDKPSAGSIEVGGRNIANMPDRRLIKYRRNRIGFIFQNYNLIPNLTALENVMLPLEFAGVKGKDRQKHAADLLNAVGFDEEKYRRKPGKLSGGEQQRVAIARALANKPALILADEPTGNLDSTTGKLIIDLLKRLSKEEKTTIIVVTHDRDIAREAENIFELRDGKLTKK